MPLSLSEQTERLIVDHMTRYGFDTPDEYLKFALGGTGQPEIVNIEELDDDTRAALKQAEAESERGEGRPWEDVRKELRAKYLGG